MTRRGSEALARVLGLDVGATKAAAAVVRADGRILTHGGATIHANDGPDAVLAELIAVGRRALGEGGRPDAIGVGVAGQVDAASGEVEFAPNLAWRREPLGDRLRREFGCPVAVANDVRAATMGEWRHGAGVGVDNLLCLWIGTGVGGSAVIDGRLVEGAANALGEIGHTQLVAGGRACRCPGRGCFEAYVGGWAIAERAQDRVRADPARGYALVQRAGSIDAIDARIVCEVARAGDPLAEEIMRVTSSYVASGAAGLVNAFNPRRLVMGGGVIVGWPELVEAARQRIRASCQPPAAHAVRVVRSALGPDAIVIGAATFARERLRLSPERREVDHRALRRGRRGA